jgi:5-(carboxyamino)imidazole ribonucleotide mutase/phosphoribosylaminoimidazole-succinocarboxamide synthase
MSALVPFVPVLMGSPSDMPHAQAIADVLDQLGIAVEMRIGSAHKTPAHVLKILARWEADPRPKVIITIAGRSNALSGLVDMQVSAPVIACPPPSSALGGADVYSSLRMPNAVAPGVVLEPANAALLAGKILGLTDPLIKARVQAFLQQAIDSVLAADADMGNPEVEP